MRERSPSFEEMMNKAIDEELQKGEPLEDIGSKPLKEGDIRPPTLEERLRWKREKSESEVRAEKPRAMDAAEEAPPEEKITEAVVVTEKKAARPEERKMAAEAKEAVVARRRKEIESEFTAMQQRLQAGEKVTEAEKEALLDNMLRAAVSEMRPALEVGISKIGREIAGPGEADKYEAGLQRVIEMFRDQNLKSSAYFENLLKYQPDAKLVREKLQERFIRFLTNPEVNPAKAAEQRMGQIRPRQAASAEKKPKRAADQKQQELREALKPVWEDIKIRRIGWKRQDERRKKTGTDDR